MWNDQKIDSERPTNYSEKNYKNIVLKMWRDFEIILAEIWNCNV